MEDDRGSRVKRVQVIQRSHYFSLNVYILKVIYTQLVACVLFHR